MHNNPRLEKTRLQDWRPGKVQTTESSWDLENLDISRIVILLFSHRTTKAQISLRMNAQADLYLSRSHATKADFSRAVVHCGIV